MGTNGHHVHPIWCRWLFFNTGTCINSHISTVQELKDAVSYHHLNNIHHTSLSKATRTCPNLHIANWRLILHINWNKKNCCKLNVIVPIFLFRNYEIIHVGNWVNLDTIFFLWISRTDQKFKLMVPKTVSLHLPWFLILYQIKNTVNVSQ